MKSTALPRNLADWLAREPKGKAPRRRIPRVSKKHKVKLVEYSHAKRMHLKEFPFCQIGPIIREAGFEVRCTGRARSIHHRKGRIGKLLCDREWFLSSCNGECHPQWIHETHKAEAIRLGLLILA